MATRKQGNVPGAVLHGAIGAVPFGNMYEGYQAGKRIGGSKGAGIGGALATNVTYPMGGGIVAGAYHGYHLKPKNVHHSVRKAPAGGHNHTKVAR